MSTARIIDLTITTTAATTAWNLQYSTDRITWSDFYTTGSALEDLSTSLLTSSVYTLDGINSPTGTKAAASYLGNWYRYRLKTTGGYGNYSDEPFRVTSYPTAAELQAYLEAHGFTLTVGQIALCGSAITSAIADFEKRTDRRPLLAGGSDLVKQYDPPTMRLEGCSTLFLKRDLYSLTSLVYTPTNSTSTTLVEGTDFDLVPYDGGDVDEGRGVDRIRFYTHRWSEPIAYSLRKSLYLTGQWGTFGVLPDDVFLALLAGGAVGMGAALTYSLSGGRLSIAEKEIKEDFGVEPARNLISGWSAQFEQAIRNYRRFSI